MCLFHWADRKGHIFRTKQNFIAWHSKKWWTCLPCKNCFEYWRRCSRSTSPYPTYDLIEYEINSTICRSSIFSFGAFIGTPYNGYNAHFSMLIRCRFYLGSNELGHTRINRIHRVPGSVSATTSLQRNHVMTALLSVCKTVLAKEPKLN